MNAAVYAGVAAGQAILGGQSIPVVPVNSSVSLSLCSENTVYFHVSQQLRLNPQICRIIPTDRRRNAGQFRSCRYFNGTLLKYRVQLWMQVKVKWKKLAKPELKK